MSDAGKARERSPSLLNIIMVTLNLSCERRYILHIWDSSLILVSFFYLGVHIITNNTSLSNTYVPENKLLPFKVLSYQPG